MLKNLFVPMFTIKLQECFSQLQVKLKKYLFPDEGWLISYQFMYTNKPFGLTLSTQFQKM